MRRCQQLLAWFPENPYLDPVPYCEHLIGGIPGVDPGDYDAPSFFQLPFYYFTPGNVHFNFITHLIIVACGVIIGLSKSPDMHPAQYLFSKQWSEREQLILDELWIVLEEKLKLRKQLLDARQTVSDKLNAIDECERRQEDSDKILSDLKKDVLLESEKVQIAREKLEKILVNFAEMGHKVIDNTQNTAVQDQLEALKQLKDRLASHTKSDNTAKDKVNITHY